MVFIPRSRIGDSAAERIRISPDIAAAAAASEALTPAARIQRADPSTVFVELGEAAQTAQIARDGVGVATVRIDPEALQNVIAGRPRLVAKVVSQSIAPGTGVPKGTAVDIVLAPPDRLPIDILQNFHIGLAQQTVGQVFDTFVRNNDAVRSVIARNQTAATLSDADRATIQKAFTDVEVPITNDPGQTVADAFNTVQAAFTFRPES